MSKLRIFVSSVQKELEAERVAIASLITTDPFLMQHCEPVLWEKEPAPARPADKPYLESLRSCQIYILLIFNDYGQLDGDVSATHHEYRLAQKLKLPTLVFLKGADDARKDTTRDFINEIKKDKHTYKRFVDREDLKPELRRGLLNLLKTEFKFEPSADESAGGREQIEASSTFESKPLPSVPWSSLDSSQVSSFGLLVAAGSASHRFQDSVCPSMHARGLLWRDTAKGEFYATAAGLLVFGQSPADYFPQVVLLADSYAGTKVSGKPRGQLNINAPLAVAIESALQFVDKHTFHPTRVVGINNVTLDEYPSRGLREALVNAVAHRNYEDASRKIMIEVFTDRVVISSPGYPPAPLTLAKLRRGNYRPCSRNPVIAQTLATFKLMEQRGSGFARMRDAMLNHGLDAPAFTEQDGYFIVTFPGPDGNYDRLKVPAGAAGLIPPAIESRLNERQKQMVALLTSGEELTSRRCEAEFGVTRPVTSKDFSTLIQLGIANKVGSGRSTRYRLKRSAES
jgi:predicted HTH transcriptional regulator